MSEINDPPPLLTAEPPPVEEGPAGEPFTFHGEATEYFRIWIVNIALTLLTLGVYSAWAKVRRRRYFRGNLELMGHRFDYVASPARLFIGNVIVLLFFLAYALFGAVYPLVKGVAVAAAIALLPWVVVRSLSFNAHNTVYRGLRFRFHAGLWAAFKVYVVNFIPVLFSAGLYYPFWVRSRRAFTVRQHRYGTGGFRFNAPEGAFYMAYVPSGVMVFASLVVAVATFFLLRRWIGYTTLTLLLTFGIYLPAALVARQFIYARVFNTAWNGTQLDEGRFEARMGTGRWLGLQLGNWAAIAATGGFLYPWASVRNARYLASCLRFHPAPGFPDLKATEASAGSAVGETAAEFVGLDFGL